MDGKTPDQLPPSPARTQKSMSPLNQGVDLQGASKLREGSVLSMVPEFVAPQPECLTPQLLPTSLHSQVSYFFSMLLAKF